MFETSKKPLTEPKRLKLGDALAELERTLIAVELERRERATEYRLRIRGIRQKQDSISQQLAEGFFEEQFEVVEVPDDDRFMVEVQRKDNAARVSVRQMTEVEKVAARERKQGALFSEFKEGHGEPLTAPVVDIAKHKARNTKPRKGSPK